MGGRGFEELKQDRHGPQGLRGSLRARASVNPWREVAPGRKQPRGVRRGDGPRRGVSGQARAERSRSAVPGRSDYQVPARAPRANQSCAGVVGPELGEPRKQTGCGSAQGVASVQQPQRVLGGTQDGFEQRGWPLRKLLGRGGDGEADA